MEEKDTCSVFSSIHVTRVSHGARADTLLPLGVNNDGTPRGDGVPGLGREDGSRDVSYRPPGRRGAEQARDLELGRDGGGQQGREQSAVVAVAIRGGVAGGGGYRGQMLRGARRGGVPLRDALRLLGRGHVGLLGKRVGRVGASARVGGQAEADRGRRLRRRLVVAASLTKVVAVVSARLARRRAAPTRVVVVVLVVFAAGVRRCRRGNGRLRALPVAL